MPSVESLVFLDQNLQVAQNLLQSTHDYIKWQAPIDVERTGYHDTFKVSCEAMRVTVRMTQIIAWLMLQKAVLEGDLTRDEALSDEYLVLRGHTCLESDSEADLELPPRLRELLKDSQNLYLRILRLDTISRKRDTYSPKAFSGPVSVI